MTAADVSNIHFSIEVVARSKCPPLDLFCVKTLLDRCVSLLYILYGSE